MLLLLFLLLLLSDSPEALGIVAGAVFLVCLIFCLVGYAHTNPSKLLDVNSALLSICFMLFLGFTDDVLDWPWRYKLILPTVASLPLLCCYNGSTSIVMPIQLRPLLWRDGSATLLGNLLGYFIVIDAQSDGRVIETGYLYLLYMGMLAVFCTNAINIYAGINGLEAGQSFVIACAVLVHNLWEISLQHQLLPNHLFSAMLMLSFVGVTLGLLRHNWFPACTLCLVTSWYMCAACVATCRSRNFWTTLVLTFSIIYLFSLCYLCTLFPLAVFVGDTFCYFSGMTFAVVGILGHFSKTLLLFFIPQIINFLWSCPQLFKIMPCPRHRLPRLDPKTGLLQPSTFPCRADQYKWLKRHADDTQCPNMTVISLCLQLFGPMSERNLCVALLALQALSCAAGLFGRYFLARFFFES